MTPDKNTLAPAAATAGVDAAATGASGGAATPFIPLINTALQGAMSSANPPQQPEQVVGGSPTPNPTGTNAQAASMIQPPPSPWSAMVRRQ